MIRYSITDSRSTVTYSRIKVYIYISRVKLYKGKSLGDMKVYTMHIYVIRV